MPSINVDGAGARMLARRVNTPAHCLEYVWDAIGQGKHYLTGGAANAYATWLAIPIDKRHVGDRHPPKDMPTFWGIRTSTGNILGDVIISNGDPIPYTVATDYPRSGVIGTPTLAQRGVQIGRVYLGWAPSMGGYDLTSASWAGGGVTPITPTEEEMTVHELAKIAANDELWYCVNRIQRYLIPPGGGPDYVAFIQGLKDRGNTEAYPEYKVVNSLSSFGAIITNQPFATGGGSTDLTPVMTKLAEVETQADTHTTQILTEIGAIPTAAENGAAARSAIVK